MEKTLHKILALTFLLGLIPSIYAYQRVNPGIFTPAAQGGGGCAANGLIGNSTTLDTNTRTVNTFVYSSFTVTTEGQISYCKVRVDPGVAGDDFTIGVYDTSGNLLAQHNITNVGSTAIDWYGGALDTPICTTPGQVLIIGYVANQSSNVSKDGTEAGHYRRTIPMTYGATIPATADFSSGNYTSVSESSVHNYMCQDDSTIP